MNAHQLIDKFSELKVLVIGDVMIDSYLWGRVDRVSPEAPVPIVAVDKRDKRLGGAANVLLNVKQLGAEPILCTVVGKDKEGEEIIDLLQKEGLSTKGVIQSDERPTTIKHRIISKSQQLLRIDSEVNHFLSQDENEAFLKNVKQLIKEVDVVVLQDYDKGVFTPDNIAEIIQLCKKENVPVSVDPKKRNFLSYQGVDLFKPNLKELSEGMNMIIDPRSDESILEAVQKLQEVSPHLSTFITLSEYGVALVKEGKITRAQAHKRTISDVSGAGDTVIAVASLCLAAGGNDKNLIEMANLAGGLVCEYVGVVPISKDRFVKEASQIQLN